MLNWPRHFKFSSEDLSGPGEAGEDYSWFSSEAFDGGKIVEPQYKWQPVTDFYKEQQATQTVDPEAETQQRLQEIKEQAKKTTLTEKKAPVMIRFFTWYLFCRAGFYLLLLMSIGSFPQSDASKWLVTTVERSLPFHAEREQRERQREMLRRYGINPDDMSNVNGTTDEDSEEARQNRLREFVMVALLVMTALTLIVAIPWLHRSWKARWGTMFYTGAFVAKAGVRLFAEWASGTAKQLSPSEISSLVLALAANGLIFCYLAFWPGVEEWFKEW